jgi:probable rRNA maturation factor
MSISVEIIVASPAWHETKALSLDQFPLWVTSACKHGAPQLQRGEITLTLADNATTQRLNRQYRQVDKATNVLSFPTFPTLKDLMQAAQQGEQLLGDIILAYEILCEEANTQGKELNAHTSHLTVHGVLHLLGYDHEEEAQAEEMEKLEIKILEELGFKNPYMCIS